MVLIFCAIVHDLNEKVFLDPSVCEDCKGVIVRGLTSIHKLSYFCCDVFFFILPNRRPCFFSRPCLRHILVFYSWVLLKLSKSSPKSSFNLSYSFKAWPSNKYLNGLLCIQRSLIHRIHCRPHNKASPLLKLWGLVQMSSTEKQTF